MPDRTQDHIQGGTRMNQEMLIEFWLYSDEWALMWTDRELVAN